MRDEVYCARAYCQLTVEEWKCGQEVSDAEFWARYRPEAPEALRGGNHGPSCERMERATGRGAGASQKNGAEVPGIGVGEG